MAPRRGTRATAGLALSILSCWMCAEFVAAAGTPPSCDTSAADQAKVWATALQELQATGFSVAHTGQLAFSGDSGFGMQGGAQVGVWQFPSFTGAGFPLGPQQVGVWLGCTPPPAKYFSFSQVVMTKQPGFHVVWAQPSDSVNMAVANTTANGGLAANSTTAVVVSADAGSALAVAQAIRNAGLSAINVISVPPALVGRLAADGSGDLMQVVHRALDFADADAGTAYNAATWPVTILSAPGNATAMPFPVANLRSRSGPVSEGELDAAIDALMGNVTMRMSELGFRAGQSIPLVATNHSDGRACLANDTFCAGGSSDALYLASQPTLSFTDTAPTQNFYVVVGVDHPQFGTATVSTLALRALGVASFAELDSRQYNGSAAFFDPYLPQQRLLYAYVIARNCTNLTPVCLEVPESMVGNEVAFSVESRSFVNPKTQTGPAASQTIAPMVLHFFGENASHGDAPRPRV